LVFFSVCFLRDLQDHAPCPASFQSSPMVPPPIQRYVGKGFPYAFCCPLFFWVFWGAPSQTVSFPHKLPSLFSLWGWGGPTRRFTKQLAPKQSRSNNGLAESPNCLWISFIPFPLIHFLVVLWSCVPPLIVFPVSSSPNRSPWC